MRRRIMVVDDAQELLQLYEDVLRDEGYEVRTYAHTVLDVSDVEEVAPDLIILDYLFGSEATGLQMLQQLKLRRAVARLPVIIASAATKQVQEIEHDLHAKGIGVLYKPFDIDTLLALVKEKVESAHAGPKQTG